MEGRCLGWNSSGRIFGQLLADSRILLPEHFSGKGGYFISEFFRRICRNFCPLVGAKRLAIAGGKLW